MSQVLAEFLVNGGPGSAAGERAERIVAHIDDGSDENRCVITYRSAGRLSAIRHMVRSLRTNRPRVVYAMDLAAAPIAAWFLGARSVRLVVDTGDAPRHFLDLIEAPWLARCAASILERIGYSRSARVIVRGPYHADQLNDAGYGNVSVIPDGVDLSVFRAHDVTELRTQLGLADVVTVGVQGNFTWHRNLGDDRGGGLGWELVTAMALRPADGVHAVLIGDGPGIAELRRLADELGVTERLHVIGRVPYTELAHYLSLCDITLLTQTDDPSSWARTTGKLPTYLATGRHVLASRVGTAADLLPDKHLVAYHGSWDALYPQRLADRLGDLAADIEQTRRDGLALRELAESFDYDDVARRCADIVRHSVVS